MSTFQLRLCLYNFLQCQPTPVNPFRESNSITHKCSQQPLGSILCMPLWSPTLTSFVCVSWVFPWWWCHILLSGWHIALSPPEKSNFLPRWLTFFFFFGAGNILVQDVPYQMDLFPSNSEFLTGALSLWYSIPIICDFECVQTSFLEKPDFLKFLFILSHYRYKKQWSLVCQSLNAMLS